MLRSLIASVMEILLFFPQSLKCAEDCQRVVEETDNCGFATYSCQCLNPPRCTPAKDISNPCNEAVEVKLEGVFGCNADNKTCQQCYYWKYEQKPVVVKEVNIFSKNDDALTACFELKLT